MELDKETNYYLDKICELTLTIMDLYTMLRGLEERGKENTKAYKEHVELLSLTVDEERNFYSYFSDNPYLAFEASKHLLNSIKDGTPIPSRAIIDQDEKEIMQTRILNNLKNIILAEPKYFVAQIDIDEHELIDGEKDGINYLYEITPVLENTTNIRLADSIINSMNNTNDKPLIDFLRKAKYYLSFLDSKLEDMFIVNSFQKVTHTFNKDINIHYDGIKKETEQSIKDLYGMGIAFTTIEDLKDINDEEYNGDEDSYNESIILTNLLSTSLLYLSNNAIEEVYNFAFDDCTKDGRDDYENDEPEDTNEIIMNIIRKTFEYHQRNLQNANKDLSKKLGDKNGI